MIKIDSNKKNHCIFTSLFTVISLLLCRSWYIDKTRLFNVDFFNLFILALFIGMTFYQLYGWWNVKSASGRVNSSVSDKRDRMHNIEFLRVIFTIGVLLSHFLHKLEIWNRGCFGVVFFFVVSGFFLLKTFDADVNILQIVKKRIIQFLPLIMAGSFLKALFASHIKVADMLAEFFLITSTGMYKDCTYNEVSWYISVLFWCSLFYICIFKFFTKDRACFVVGILTFIGTSALVKRGVGLNAYLGDVGDIGYIFDMRLIYGLTGIGWGCLVYAMYINFSLANSENNTNKLFYTSLELLFLLYSILFMFNNKFYVGNFAFFLLHFNQVLGPQIKQRVK